MRLEVDDAVRRGLAEDGYVVLREVVDADSLGAEVDGALAAGFGTADVRRSGAAGNAFQ